MADPPHCLLFIHELAVECTIVNVRDGVPVVDVKLQCVCESIQPLTA